MKTLGPKSVSKASAPGSASATRRRLTARRWITVRRRLMARRWVTAKSWVTTRRRSTVRRRLTAERWVTAKWWATIRRRVMAPHRFAVVQWFADRPRAADVLLACALTAMALLFRLSEGIPAAPSTAALLIALLIAQALPTVWRRRHPWPVMGAVSIAYVVYELTDPMVGFRDGLYVTFAAYAVAHHARTPASLAVVGMLPAVVLTPDVIRAWLGPPLPPDLRPGPVEVVLIAGLSWGLWLLGDSQRRIRADAARLRDLAARLRAEQETSARRAVTAERARIARDLHDLVAHHVSAIAMQARATAEVVADGPRMASPRVAKPDTTVIGATPARSETTTETTPTEAETTTETTPTGVEATIGTASTGTETTPTGAETTTGTMPTGIEATVGTALAGIGAAADTALVEMRRMLGLLSDDSADADDPPGLRPEPSLRHLDQLAATARTAGCRVEIALDEEVLETPAAVQVSAYRVVQEALTNVLKHAGTADVRIGLRQSGDRLAVVVDNGPSAPAHAPLAGSGLGLIGMRERTALFGGTLRAGPSDGGWRVEATFRWERQA
ncbi:sensor histidine kinase [Streptosporangium sp. NPDC000396]|uniref:sensor histidine kinase n=1 Tax=Streptosporangium sp. NPDC000396 TaxID=3366185 RepID=UPI0036CFD712